MPHEHCDNYIGRPEVEECLRWFLFYNRLPATEKPLVRDRCGGEPRLWAWYDDRWVRVVMASRFGDVGITERLDADHGYDKRVAISDLSGFTDRHPTHKPRRR